MGRTAHPTPAPRVARLAAGPCGCLLRRLIDGPGARVSGYAVACIDWVFVADGFLFPLAIIATRGRGIVSRGRRAARPLCRAGDGHGRWAALPRRREGHSVSVWAMTAAPIALAAALRETSILFAVLTGWEVFGERMDRAKAIASGLIVAGLC